MNVQKGDLARVVNTGSRHDGHIVTVNRFIGYKLLGEVFTWRGHLLHSVDEAGPLWEVEWAAGIAVCFDRYLRPIRDPGDDAVDEMVVRVGSARLLDVPA